MNKIKQARLAAGLTQIEVCLKFGIPPRTLQAWEQGRRVPPEWVANLIIKEIHTIAEA